MSIKQDIEVELAEKRRLTINYGNLLSLREKTDSDPEAGEIQKRVEALLIAEFAKSFGIGREEAEQELELRARLLKQNAQALRTKVKEKAVVDIAKRNLVVRAKLPKEVLEVLDGGEPGTSPLLRLFKKTGRDHTSLVVTRADGEKLSFRKYLGKTEFEPLLKPTEKQN